MQVNWIRLGQIRWDWVGQSRKGQIDRYIYIDKQIDRQIDGKIDRQMERQIDRQADRQIDTQIGTQIHRQMVRQKRKNNRLIDWKGGERERIQTGWIDILVGRQMGREIDRQINRQIDIQIGWQVDRLILLVRKICLI